MNLSTIETTETTTPAETPETRMALHQMLKAYLACDLSDRRAARELLDTIFEQACELTRHPFDTPSYIIGYIDRRRYLLRLRRGAALLLDDIAEALPHARELGEALAA